MERSSLFTDHAIDGIPELADLPAYAIALDMFKMNYPLPATSARMADDSRSMSYRLRFEMNTEHYLKIAGFVIDRLDLPLKAELDQFVVGKVVFETNLVITYIGQ
jgi:hypothetical protein